MRSSTSRRRTPSGPATASPGRGFLFGGSTGTVVSGALDWLARHGAAGLTAVAIAPDLGERYLDTIYQTNWVQDLYGEDVLRSGGLTAASRLPPAADSRSTYGGKPADALTTDPTDPLRRPLPASRRPIPRRSSPGCWPTSCTSARCRSTATSSLTWGRLPGHGYFCARVRKRGDLPSVSMKDIYAHPTIASLAAALTRDAPAQAEQAPAPGQVTADVAVSAEQAPRASAAQYVTCGGAAATVLRCLRLPGRAGRGLGCRCWVSAPYWPGRHLPAGRPFRRGGFAGVCVLPVVPSGR